MGAYLELRNYINKRGEQPIRTVIVIKGKTVYGSTGYHVEARFWDEKRRQVKSSHPNATEYNAALQEKVNQLNKIYAEMDAAGRVNHKTVITARKTGGLFSLVAAEHARRFEMMNKIETADKYRSAAKLVEQLFPKLNINDIDDAWMEDYRAKLQAGGYKYNTIVGKLSFIRTIINRAVAEKLIMPISLSTKIGTYRPKNGHVLTRSEIDRLWGFKGLHEWQNRARDMFLFSYYAAGMRFGDMLLIGKDSLYREDGKFRLRWTAGKTEDSTGIVNDIIVADRLQQIIDSLPQGEKTLFGLIDPELDPVTFDKEKAKINASINKGLIAIWRRLDIQKHLTIHDARHTFSRHAKELGDGNIYAIKDALTHSKIATTEIYLSSDKKQVDDLLRKVYAEG